MTSVKILVACHKPAVLVKSDIFIPVQAGRAIAGTFGKDGYLSANDQQWLTDNLTGDDSGDNISKLNRHFAELTALYWAWKNPEKIGRPDYLGLTQYRRHFIFCEDKEEIKVNSLSPQWKDLCFDEERIRDTLANCDVVTTKALTITQCKPPVTTVKEHFESALWSDSPDLELLLKIIRDRHPEYGGAAERYFAQQLGYCTDMFIMKWPLVDRYCRWLFDILFEMHRRLDYSDASVTRKRLPALLAPHLLGIFVTHLEGEGKHAVKKLPCLTLTGAQAPVRDIEPAFAANNVPIVFCVDAKYVPYLGVAIASLAANSSTGRNYDILVFEQGLGDRDKREIATCVEGYANIKLRVIPIETYVDIDPKRFYTVSHRHESEAAYFRLFAPMVLSLYDQVVYLDCDLVLLADVAELYAIDLGDALLGACRAFEIYELWVTAPQWIAGWDIRLQRQEKYSYFNSGVLLLNLKRMRQEKFTQLSVDILDEMQTPRNFDQDVLNIAAYGRVRYINSVWNSAVWRTDRHLFKYTLPERFYEKFLECRQQPKIMHYFTSIKPWHFPEREYAHHFWHYARQTIFYERLLVGLLSRRVSPKSAYKPPDGYVMLFFTHQFYRIKAFFTRGRRREAAVARRRACAKKRKTVKAF